MVMHSIPIKFGSNVVSSIGGRIEDHSENLFLNRFFKALESKMKEDFWKFTFVVHRASHLEANPVNIELLPGDSRHILIVVGDEREIFPAKHFGKSYGAVFCAYGALREIGSNVYSFPLGYLHAAGQTQSIAFGDRKISCFFSGNLNNNRVDFYKQFNRILWLPKNNLKSDFFKGLARRIINRICPEKEFNDHWPQSRIAFTDGFGKGMEPKLYAQTIANSKIALCPPGFVSPETLRHWEAMRLGCVIISAPLPKNRFYYKSPILEVDDWSSLCEVIEGLLSNPEELYNLHLSTSSWWTQVCSEDAVADYVAGVIMRGGNFLGGA